MRMYSIGNQDLLRENPIAVYCSREIPPAVYQPALELVQGLMAQPITLAGGWQSMLEKEALKMRGPSSVSNIIYFLAKGIQKFKVPHFLRSDLDNGKVLILSLWMNDERIDQIKVQKRDDLMLDKIDQFLFFYAQEGGNLEKLFFRCLSQEKRVFILNHSANQGWLNPKVTPVSEKDVGLLLN